MKYLSVEPKHADRLRKAMLRLGLFDKTRAARHSRSYVLFPTLDIGRAKAKKLIEGIGVKVVDLREKPAAPKKRYRDLLGGIVGNADVGRVARGYDLLGSTALIEVPKELPRRAKEIARALMESNKQVATVLAKEGAVSGEYRIRKVRYLAGKRTYMIHYRENGCTFDFDIRKTFFSNRLSFERARLIRLVKPREHVMVMFAGVGPFAIEIAKAVQSAKVVAIELNRDSHRYMLDNIKANNVDNVKAVLGDVHEVSGHYKEFADRIIMPLPMSSLDFLDDVWRVARERCVVHIYAIGDEKSVFADVKSAISEHARRRGYSVRVVSGRVARPYSPREVEAVVDFVISKGLRRPRTG